MGSVVVVGIPLGNEMSKGRNKILWFILSANFFLALIFLHFLRVFFASTFHQRHQSNRIIGFSLILMLLLMGYAHADEVIMKNGDRLKGEIVSMEAGKLIFRTPYASRNVIPWGQVKRLTSDGTLEVSLPDKETLKGRAVKGEDGVLILEPESGPATKPIAMSKVSGISPSKPPPSWKWTGSASVGIDYQKGNTDKQSYTGDLTVGLAKFPHRINFYGFDWVNQPADGKLHYDSRVLFKLGWQY